MPQRRGNGWKGMRKILYPRGSQFKKLQGEKTARGKGNEVSFHIKQHPTNYIGSADDICTELGV